jgi:fucose 4-O-acetylase-like acetyltransferase
MVMSYQHSDNKLALVRIPYILFVTFYVIFEVLHRRIRRVLTNDNSNE